MWPLGIVEEKSNPNKEPAFTSTTFLLIFHGFLKYQVIKEKVNPNVSLWHLWRPTIKLVQIENWVENKSFSRSLLFPGLCYYNGKILQKNSYVLMLSITTTRNWETDHWTKNQLNSLSFLVSNLWKKASLPVNRLQQSVFVTIIKMSEGVHLKVLDSQYCPASYLLYVVLTIQCTQWLRALKKEFAAGVSRYFSGTFVIPTQLKMPLNCKPNF